MKWRGQLFGCDRTFDERQIQCRKILHDFLSIPGCHIHVYARIVGLEPHHVLRQVIGGDGHRRTDAQGAGGDLLQPADVVLRLAVVVFPMTSAPVAFKKVKKNRRMAPRGRPIDLESLEKIRGLLGNGPRRRDFADRTSAQSQDAYGYISAKHVVALAHEIRTAIAGPAAKSR